MEYLYIIYKVNRKFSDRFIDDKIPLAIVKAHNNEEAIFKYKHFFHENVEYFIDLHDGESEVFALNQNKCSFHDYSMVVSLFNCRNN